MIVRYTNTIWSWVPAFHGKYVCMSMSDISVSKCRVPTSPRLAIIHFLPAIVLVLLWSQAMKIIIRAPITKDGVDPAFFPRNTRIHHTSLPGAKCRVVLSISAQGGYMMEILIISMFRCSKFVFTKLALLNSKCKSI
jgi:hypothetical protein